MSCSPKPPEISIVRLILTVIIIAASIILITVILFSCKKEECIRRSSKGLTYEDVKNYSVNVPSYVRYPIDFATKIYITAANNDTSYYIPFDLDNPTSFVNTTNYIKEIDISVIHWEGGIGPVAQYSTTPKSESTKFKLKGKAKYDLVDINSGFPVTDELIKFQINPMNNNEEIFQCYNSYGTLYSDVYQQKSKSSNEKSDYWLMPEVYIRNIWKFKDLRCLGKIINSIVRKSADTTIVYYSKY